MPQNTTNNNEPVIPNVNTDNQTANPNNNTTAVPDANAPEASVASNTNAVQQTAASMPTANNSAATLETETTNDAADNHQDTEQQPTFSTEDIVKVSEEIKATIENGIPVDEDGKESLNEKFNDLAEAMETFGHDLKTEKGTDKYEESKDYANEISNLITDITNNDGSQNEKIKEGILNLLDKTIPQTVDDVKAVEIEALSNNDIKNDTDKVDNTTGNNRVDISQFDQLGEEFQNAFKETKADNKQQVYDKLVNLFHKNFGYNQNSTMIAHSLCKNYEEDKLGKINGARSKIGDEKNNLLGITKGHRFESKVEVGKFERSLDRIEREIDNIGNNLKSDASIKICQGLKVEFSAMRAHIDQGLEKLNAVGSKSNIKGFQSDVFKTLDAINERIDEIKENEFIVLGSDIDTHLGIDLNVDNPDLKEKDTVDQKETKGIEKTGDAKVDRYNAKLISITGLDKKKAEEKGSNKENSDINGKDKTNSESTSTTNRLEKSPYYTWNLLVRDIYAYSRNVPINGMNVTAGKIVADISNLIQAVGIPAAVIVSIVGGLAVLIDRVVNGPEKGDADKVERTEKVQEFVNEVCKGLEEKGLLNDVEISSDDVETTENQDQVEQEQNPDEEDYVDNNNPDNDEANQEIEESKENSVEQEESDNQEDVEQNQEETEIQNETTDVEESEEDPEHVESEEEESDSPEVTEDDNQDESDNSDPQKGEDTHDESGEDSTDTNVDSTNKQEDQNPDDNKKSQDTSKSENKDTEVEKEQTPESENKVSKDSEDNQKTQETTKTESKDTEV